MKCNDTGKLIIDKLAGELSSRQAAKLDKHIAACDTCRKEFTAFSKAWKLSGKTLKKDTFTKRLSPNRRAEIFGIAKHEEKRQKSFWRLTRLVEYLAVIAIFFILAGMMLPALNQAREKSRDISAQSRLKMARLTEMQKEMDDESGSDSGLAEDLGDVDHDGFPSITKYKTTAKKSKKKYKSMPAPAYRPKSKEYSERIRTAMAGVTNTLGEQSKLEKEYAPRKQIVAYKKLASPKDRRKEKAKSDLYASLIISKARVEKLATLQRMKVEQKMNYNVDVSRSRSVSTLRMVGAQKIFRVNLKLWNMTTISNVKKYLKTHNYPVPNNIIVYKASNTIFIRASKATIKKLDKLFKKLQQEEKELKDLSKGLPFIKCISRPVSTFSIDTDTASYVQARKNIRRGERPDPFKIRPEEFINYFDYNYRSPRNSTFAIYLEAAPSPFRPNNTLFRIGIQGKRLGPDANTRTHYTILLDTSGSMAVKDRMELAKKALAMPLKKLKSSDYVSLLLCGNRTYSVFSVKALNPHNRQRLLKILNNVTPRGVADFAKGISKAYSFAGRHYLRNSSNRVIIISDGIFELKAAGRQNITTQIEAARKRGISNIVIGLGGDGDDNMLEKVASIGDGSYVFLDTEREAKELFTTQFEARFREIARDVKIQVEFNPDAVKSYRQIGYKNRQLSKADFRNDKVDAGEVGSGQAVTALYELKLKDNIPDDAIVATIRIRYKKAGDMSVEEKAFYLSEGDIKEKFRTASPNFKLAALVAEFAESLRYPETQDIASLRGVADKLNGTWMKHYRKDYKVTELLALIKRSR